MLLSSSSLTAPGGNGTLMRDKTVRQLFIELLIDVRQPAEQRVTMMALSTLCPIHFKMLPTIEQVRAMTEEDVEKTFIFFIAYAFLPRGRMHWHRQVTPPSNPNCNT